MNKESIYDFVIVGAGFAGATCARLLTDKHYKCLVIDERPFVGGNCLTDRQNDIDIHFLGAHILHTNNEFVWEFLKLWGEIHEYRYNTYAWNSGKIYQLPVCMQSLSQLWGQTWPYEIKQNIDKDTHNISDSISNIENYCLTNYGNKVYNTIIKGFYEKKYGVSCKELPISCLHEKFNDIWQYTNSYYDEKFQGVPENGYVNLVENMLGDDIDVLLKTNFLANKEKYIGLGNYIIYTCELDKFFDYCMGELSWGTIQFELKNESNHTNNLAGTPIINFPDTHVDWFRLTEHKWLTPWRNIPGTEFDKTTFVTYEFYKQWRPGDEVYFPIPHEQSIKLNERYKQKLLSKYPMILLCGGKPKFEFKTICETIEDAIALTDKFPEKEE